MVRSALFAIGGLLLGLVLHLVVILNLPAVANTTAFGQLLAITPTTNKTVPLVGATAGVGNPLRLDPDLSYAACRLDLRNGPGEVTGSLPVSFWSVAVYDPSGTVIYSTTNRDGIGQSLDLGVFDPAQTRLLAEQKIDVNAGLLIVESRSDDVVVVVRLAPSQPAEQPRYTQQLGKLNCRNIKL
ncbi:MAG: DUF1254 domain-containing protein [Devosia sp.]